ncbi:GNAT family N-acetyltransferase [Dethiosulfatarculus sandiegensis]|nr:GNAT family N-acetyltransferase [Dethiosulfatarculus sandiegensis]
MAPKQCVTCLDKLGRPFSLGPCLPDSRNSVLKMYDAFDPMPASQGLPPENPETRSQWVDTIIKNAHCFAAWEGDSVVGHAALLPNETALEGEYLIFVSKGYRNRGLGTLITLAVIEFARQKGMTRLWLEVETFNFAAVNLYRKMGFRFCGGFTCERMMTLEIGSQLCP